MLHDVVIVIYGSGGAGGPSQRHVVTVDATGGDDAAERGAVEAVALARGRSWQIVSIGPCAEALRDYAAPEGVVEGADVDGDDHEAPAKRSPGRPKKVVEPA